MKSQTSPRLWRHFSTDDNSADRLTRVLSVEQLASKDTRWDGPLCIYRGKISEWAIDRIMKQQRKRSGNSHAYRLTATLKGQRCWLSKTMLRSGLKRDTFLPGLVSSEHWPGFIASYTIV